MQTMKILVVGPSKSHKTAITSFLAGMTDNLTYNPGPTVSARILEVDRATGGGSSVNLEIWDVAGDQSYEATWPAIQKDTEGVLLVYNAEIVGHAKEAELWAEWFIQRIGLPSSCCACIGVTGSSGGGGLGAPNLEGIAIDTVAVDSPEALRKVFDRLVSRLLKKR